jgi:hypothetical protein
VEGVSNGEELKIKRRKLRGERLRKLYRKLATCTRQCRCGIAGLTPHKPRWHVEVLVRKGKRKKEKTQGRSFNGEGLGMVGLRVERNASLCTGV